MTSQSIRTIKVTIGYRGRATGEQYIAPGDYLEVDPALFGLADFLVESGRATVGFTFVQDDFPPLTDEPEATTNTGEQAPPSELDSEQPPTNEDTPPLTDEPEATPKKRK